MATFAAARIAASVSAVVAPADVSHKPKTPRCLESSYVAQSASFSRPFVAIGTLPQKTPLIVPFPLMPTVAPIPNAFAMV
jgi:hypothetical protein